MHAASVFRPRVLALVGAMIASLVSHRVCIAQDVEDATREACKPDAMRLCAVYIPDVVKITNCMTERFKEVSPECRAAMIKEDNRARARVQRSRESLPSAD
jgi:hypothetical protein